MGYDGRCHLGRWHQALRESEDHSCHRLGRLLDLPIPGTIRRNLLERD
jgi:hypothetical protein